MEAINFFRKALIYLLFLSVCTIVQAQSNVVNDEVLNNLIEKYESKKDEENLRLLSWYGKDSELVLKWFDQNTSMNNDVLIWAGLTFFSSSIKKWNLKSEEVLLRGLQVQPTPRTAHFLGEIYIKGLNKTKDTRKGCEMYERAYKMNPTTAVDNVQYGFCLLSTITTRDFRKSDSEACKIFDSVANQWFNLPMNMQGWESGRAYYFHGYCLKEGLAGQKNLKSAVEWYQRGMVAGHGLAAFTYAEHLENGVGILRDTKAALSAYNNAADLGYEEAQNRLGVIYAEGVLVTKNLVEAYKWFLIATSNGYEPAKDNRKRAEAKLTKAETRSAELAAKKWLEANGN